MQSKINFSFSHLLFNLRIPCGLPQGDLVKYIKNFRCCEAASPWRNTLWSCHRDSQGEGNFLLVYNMFQLTSYLMKEKSFHCVCFW